MIFRQSGKIFGRLTEVRWLTSLPKKNASLKMRSLRDSRAVPDPRQDKPGETSGPDQGSNRATSTGKPGKKSPARRRVRIRGRGAAGLSPSILPADREGLPSSLRDNRNQSGSHPSKHQNFQNSQAGQTPRTECLSEVANWLESPAGERWSRGRHNRMPVCPDDHRTPIVLMMLKDDATAVPSQREYPLWLR
jgi:hypothetical protein